MTAKVLFLDFDGVLHPGICTEQENFCRMPVLEAALRDASLAIVVASSWRFHHPWEFLLSRFPATLRPMVRGYTGEAVTGRHARWEEIRQYRERHGIRDWRALDDSAFEFPSGCPELILCNGAVGLAEPQVHVLQQWLKA